MYSNQILNKIALALDFSTKEEVVKLLEELNPKPKILKIGLQLISSLGIKEAVVLLKQLCPSASIFLDLKLYDIPNTISKAIENFKNLEIDYLTVHILGGHKMLKQALKASENKVNLVGVSILTSYSEEEFSNSFFHPANELKTITLKLCELAVSAGLNWIVASPQESVFIKERFKDLKIITPGIRLTESNIGDQQRIDTPRSAIEKGSDMLVIGRPIYSAKNPNEIWEKVLSLY